MKSAMDRVWGWIVGFWRWWSWARFWRLARVGALSLFMLVFFKQSTPPPGDLHTGAAAHARNSLFNYVGWELDALASKAFESIFGVHAYLDEETRSDTVRAYMADLERLYRLEYDIWQVYSDPAVDDPAAQSADLRAERDALRADLQTRQGMVESILEEQISTVLVEAGLGWLGQVLPPVALRFTPLPDVLILSPRDEIRVAASLSLEETPVEERTALEDVVDADLDVASLVVDIGGMALYPSMVGETYSLTWGIETSAHEWVHHYLFFFPLGLNYFDDSNPETRAINETTADLVGKEIAQMVFRRYYPELAAQEGPQAASSDEETEEPSSPEADPNAFDYGEAMHETRVRVDALLAEGRVDEAEAYMEARRVFFNEHGVVLRKLNQAFFAFYGGYQAEGAPEAGDDPIGPAVIALRAQSESLVAFLAAVRNITTTEELLAAVEALTPTRLPFQP